MNKSNMEEMIEFPVLYTFKAMGENNEKFISDMRSVFAMKKVDSFDEKKSSKGTYVSVSVTVEVNSFNELEYLYKNIKALPGLKYHL
jgi:putative lipoic acid-binding regulatory protein